MRLVSAATLALALAGVPAAAQERAPVAFSPGEVLLEIEGSGRSVVRADTARVTLPVMQNLAWMMYGPGVSPEEHVETQAVLAVDFVLAPLR